MPQPPKAAFALLLLLACLPNVWADEPADHLRQLQMLGCSNEKADWGHWGALASKYSSWQEHSNRLIPVYSFGIKLSSVKGRNSVYRDEGRLSRLYGTLPPRTLNRQAEYFDQTDISRLQRAAVQAGKKYIVLVVFDGMDWQTSRAAAIHKTGRVSYTSGRGRGLLFQDYSRAPTDFGWMVTSPAAGDAKIDVNVQRVIRPGAMGGGYFAALGGRRPWDKAVSTRYLTAESRSVRHDYTDSAAAATSMTTGIKTYTGSINCDLAGRQLEPIARQLQRQHGFSVGLVTSVPISHATPAAAYANNVSRRDYQDLTRDLLGIPSISHRGKPLPGVDVLLGGGWDELLDKDEDATQGHNFVPGNEYITAGNLREIDIKNGGRYQVVQRQAGVNGRESLEAAAKAARGKRFRLFGMFGVQRGHLPFRTADGRYDPVGGVYKAEVYSAADIAENPTLADMTRSALQVLETNQRGFWLMVEAGDVDWANHDNNIDNSVGAVLSGEAAFAEVLRWVERHNAWNETAVIVTADHGHLLEITDAQKLVPHRAGIAGTDRD